MPFSPEESECLSKVGRDDAVGFAERTQSPKALEVLTELANMTTERDRLRADFIAPGLA